MPDDTDDKTTDPRRSTGMPVGHHSPAGLIHFIAAQELATKGLLSPDTVELLVFFSPRPITNINPISDRPGKTLVTSSIVGAGRAFNGGWYVDTDEDVKAGGQKSEDMIEQGTFVVAQTAKAHLKQVMQQQTLTPRQKAMMGSAISAIKDGTAVKTSSDGKPSGKVH